MTIPKEQITALKRELDKAVSNGDIFSPHKQTMSSHIVDYLAATGRLLPEGCAAVPETMMLDYEARLDMIRYLLPLAKGYVHAKPCVRSTECIIEDAEAMIAAAKEGE